ncbi:hypothetical protein C0416_03275 [bacterium]|nr:hypothetical protein [bacterium]
MNPFAFKKESTPNYITGGRIVLFMLTLLSLWLTYRTNEVLHLTFCILGGIIYALDGLDGWVARTFKWQSPFGEIFDPAGDKIVAYSMLAYFQMLDIFPIWALAIILFRDIVLSTIRLASLKYHFEFKTSKMGKLRTNIIGFGGAILYILHYWGDYIFFVELKGGLVHTMLIVLMLLTITNMVEFPGKFMLKIFPRFIDKLGAVITFVIAAAYPPRSIAYSMVWITLYTLWDYGKAFKHEVDKARSENRTDVKKFLYSFALYLLMGLVLTLAIIGLLEVSTLASIIAANVIFAILLVQNFSMLKAKASQFRDRLAKMRKNRRIRKTLKQRQRHQKKGSNGPPLL